MKKIFFLLIIFLISNNTFAIEGHKIIADKKKIYLNLKSVLQARMEKLGELEIKKDKFSMVEKMYPAFFEPIKSKDSVLMDIFDRLNVPPFSLLIDKTAPYKKRVVKKLNPFVVTKIDDGWITYENMYCYSVFSPRYNPSDTSKSWQEIHINILINSYNIDYYFPFLHRVTQEIFNGFEQEVDSIVFSLEPTNIRHSIGKVYHMKIILNKTFNLYSNLLTVLSEKYFLDKLVMSSINLGIKTTNFDKI